MPLLGCMLHWNLESFDVAWESNFRGISWCTWQCLITDGLFILTWGLFSLEPFIPHVNDSKLRAAGSRAWALDAAVVPRPLFSSGRLYKSVRPPWHVLIQRCSTVVQSPSSPDSISVFGMKKNHSKIHYLRFGIIPCQHRLSVLCCRIKKLAQLILARHYTS